MIIVVLIVVGIVAALAARKSGRKGRRKEVNYNVFFVIGICWFPLGIVFMTIDSPLGFMFFPLGLAYLAIGLVGTRKQRK